MLERNCVNIHIKWNKCIFKNSCIHFRSVLGTKWVCWNSIKYLSLIFEFWRLQLREYYLNSIVDCTLMQLSILVLMAFWVSWQAFAIPHSLPQLFIVSGKIPPTLIKTWKIDILSKCDLIFSTVQFFLRKSFCVQIGKTFIFIYFIMACFGFRGGGAVGIPIAWGISQDRVWTHATAVITLDPFYLATRALLEKLLDHHPLKRMSPQ